MIAWGGKKAGGLLQAARFWGVVYLISRTGTFQISLA